MKMKLDKRSKFALGSLIMCGVLVVVDVVFVLLPTYSLAGNIGSQTDAEMDNKLQRLSTISHIITGAISALVIVVILLMIQSFISDRNRKKNGR